MRGYQIAKRGENPLSLGKRLRNTRALRGLTQAQIADAVGVTNVTLSRYESGERRPEPEMLKKLAGILGVSADYLLGTSDAMHGSENAAGLAERWPNLSDDRRRSADNLERAAQAIGLKMRLPRNITNEIFDALWPGLQGQVAGTASLLGKEKPDQS